jgi:CheY-like chemotaxis protein
VESESERHDNDQSGKSERSFSISDSNSTANNNESSAEPVVMPYTYLPNQSLFNVIIADDDTVARQILVRMLSREGTYDLFKSFEVTVMRITRDYVIMNVNEFINSLKGIKAVVCRDGREAFDKVIAQAETSSPYHLLITDINSKITFEVKSIFL